MSGALLSIGLGAVALMATANSNPPAPVATDAPVAQRAPGPAGSLVIVESNHALPLVHVVVAARSGSTSDPRHREGMMNVAAEMARRGAGKQSREEMDAALDQLGATLEVHTEPDTVRFEGEVLARNLDPFLAILGDIIMRPRFAAAELARTKRELTAHIDEARTDDQALCARFFLRNVYGDHPYGYPPDGTPAALEAMTAAELSAHFRRHFVGKNLIFAATGAVTLDDFQQRLGRVFADLSPAPAPKPVELRTPVPPKGWRIQLVDKPERQQTQLMFGHATVAASDPDFLPLSVALAAFGGHGMSTTLMNEVRTKRGLAYGAYMSLSERRGRATAAGWVFSANEKAVPTLKLVLRLYVALMENGLTPERVAFFKDYLMGSYASEMDPPDHRLDARVTAEVVGLPADFVDTYPARLRAVTPAQVGAAIKRHVHARDLAITMVSTAAVMKRLLIDAKVKESAIDVVGFESF